MSKSNHKNKSKPTSKGPPCFSEFGQKAKENYFNRGKEGRLLNCSCGRSTYTYKNANFDCRIDTDSKITGTLTLNEKFLSSMNTSASFSLPDYQSSKLRVRIRQEYAALSTSVALNKSPAITFSAAVGSSSIALGMETEANKGDLLTASCVLYLNKQKKHAAVVEFTQKLSTKRNTLTVEDHMLLIIKQ
ncbi:unnamed protein product [Prunus armeniaca]|uniref:Uncharacterized protein n=1 Tax=Prunus armeniaca TaxID=36596 RepID=A0A6J5YBV9_PRUAR|nr:unnamed protein product [Prunus armeniaca]